MLRLVSGFYTSAQRAVWYGQGEVGWMGGGSGGGNGEGKAGWKSCDMVVCWYTVGGGRRKQQRTGA